STTNEFKILKSEYSKSFYNSKIILFSHKSGFLLLTADSIRFYDANIRLLKEYKLPITGHIKDAFLKGNKLTILVKDIRPLKTTKKPNIAVVTFDNIDVNKQIIKKYPYNSEQVYTSI